MPVGKDDNLPVDVVTWSGWRAESKKLQKVFEFDSRKQKEAFVIEILKYDRDSDCIIETRIKNSKVAVILHAISPDLSEIEFEAKVDIDKIRKDVLTNHFSFWLNWDDLVLIKRIKGNKKRPLASKSTEQEIKAIINKRKKIYSKANFKINCNKLTKSEIVKTIIKTYELN